jgi:Tfp pilus assembly protein PilV
MAKSRGVSLLELEVSIALLGVAISGMAAILVSDIRQLQASECRRQLYSYLPPDPSQAVFTELTSDFQPGTAVYSVRVQGYAVGTTSITAVVSLEAR